MRFLQADNEKWEDLSSRTASRTSDFQSLRRRARKAIVPFARPSLPCRNHFPLHWIHKDWSIVQTTGGTRAEDEYR